jgi:hypothetical protein
MSPKEITPAKLAGVLRCAALGRNWRHKVQSGFLPSRKSTDQVRNLSLAVVRQDTGSDGRAVATGALQNDCAVTRYVVELPLQPIERDVDTVLNMLVTPFRNGSYCVQQLIVAYRRDLAIDRAPQPRYTRRHNP